MNIVNILSLGQVKEQSRTGNKRVSKWRIEVYKEFN